MKEKGNRYKLAATAAVALLITAGALVYFVGPGWSGELLAPKERIIFSSSHDGRWDIYTIAADGTELVKITEGRNKKDNKNPSFSPDGSRIIFHSNRSGNWELYTMNVSGDDVKRLTTHAAADAMGSFSPDGSKIVFHSNRSGRSGGWDIFVMDADGSEPQRLTDNPATDRQPAWSPDGKKIVFVSNRDGNDEIYIMDADGSNQRRLTDNPATDVTPKFSPDGKKIVFESDRNTSLVVGQIHVMNADGSQVKALTGGSANAGCGYTEVSNHRPAFSPDGKRIVFISNASTKWCSPQVFVMDADGSNPRQITDIRGEPSERNYAGKSATTVDFPAFSPVSVPAPAQ